MALKLDDKKAIVAEVNEAAGSALAAVLADYRGLNVSEMTELRVKARDSNVYLRVIRNTLARRAMAGTEFECLTEAFTGPSLLALSVEDPGAAARLMKDFAKSHDKLQVRALAIGGELLDPSRLDAVASLPTRDEALAMLMGTMLAPITKLAQTLNAVPSKLVRTLDAVRVQKEEQAA
ncbi:MAG: 50S ribosomal protein L10 [Gammaproteobacteria bacterium]|nr:MAG: 50S ribosomal protein L10 [Gammaproteobacteria bacterium]